MEPTIRGNRVRFRLRAPEASMVNCVGNFNSWDLSRGVMSRNGGGVWEMETVVPILGSYDYKFVVDGRWIADPENPEYGKDHHDRINSRFGIQSSAQSAEILSGILRALTEDPPAHTLGPRRRWAFEELDPLFGLPNAPHAVPVRQAFRDAFERLTADTDDGIQHLYNAGFLLRRGGFGLGIDLVTTRTAWNLYWEIPDRLVEALAARIDVLVVSHLHPDHLDVDLAERVLSRGGRILAPSEVLPRLPEGTQGVGPEEVVTAGPWRIRMPPGRHVYDDLGRLPLRLVECECPNGPRVLHTSDHDYTLGIPHTAHPNLVIPKSGGVSPLVEDRLALRNLLLHLKPGFVLPCHIRELGHPVKGGREPYATALSVLDDRPAPGTILFWGERIPWEAIRA